jgi:hypothetical protein
MKKTHTSVLMVTFAVALSLVLATGSQVQAQRGPSNEDLTIFQILERQDGARAFLALAQVAEDRCPGISRKLDRNRNSLVALVPHDVAIAEFLGVTPRTFEDLDVEQIVDLLPEILARKGLDLRDVCRLLRRHISKAEAQTVQELLERGFITMLNGDELPVAIGRGGVTVARFAPITVYDVFTQNGIIQYLDRVIVVVPPPADETVTVFVTQTAYQGDLGGLAGADAICQQRAEAAGLPGTDWTAWLSDDTTNARNRIPRGEYRRVDGTLVASNRADLFDGELAAPINLNEYGQTQASFAWTATNLDGTGTGNTCNNWTDASSEQGGCPDPGDPKCGSVGSTSATNAEWTKLNAAPFQCSAQYNLYCFGGSE